MISGGLLKIHPSELKLPFEVKRQSSCCMQLTNKTDNYVAFKVKTTSPKKYSVRPNMGIVQPRSAITITVTMQAQKEAPPDYQSKDKFLIQSVIANDGATTKDITAEMFNKAPDKVVEEFKLRVVYIPANPPSPVPEESEEGISPRPSMLENKTQSSTLFDAVSRSLEEAPRDESEEELLRQERRKNRSGFSVTFVTIVALLGIIIGFLIKKT
ncbi:vesicle-associated protein 1-3 isoform X3 [Musa acuminata AAA Group]|uniref:vesicle-associated protein 1-3-like isoform X3 n=1 Tax=Musa acuminata AAA Group TaxID=214697 RepID=UPI0031D5C309